MKPGDLITCSSPGLRIRSVPNPTFSSRGRERFWEAGTPALILSVTKYSLRLEILIEGEIWWVSNLKSLVRLSLSSESMPDSKTCDPVQNDEQHNFVLGHSEAIDETR